MTMVEMSNQQFNCLFRFKIEKKACGQSNQETRIVGGKPTGVNVKIIF